MIVTTLERAKQLKKPPVYVKGIGFGDGTREIWWDRSNYTRTDAATRVTWRSRPPWISIEDVDVAEFYDCFTTEMIMYVEDYGWCERGTVVPSSAPVRPLQAVHIR